MINWLLQLGRDDEVDQLMRRYKRDGGCECTWSSTLAAFRKHGDHSTSRKALARAVATNSYVADYLLGRKKLPTRLPDYVAFGGEDEAAAYTEAAAPAWAATQGALTWLAGAPKSIATKPRRPVKRKAG